MPRKGTAKRTITPGPGSRLHALVNGEITVEDLTTEELLSGKLNDRNGMRTGRPSNLVPREMYDAMIRELLSRGDALVRESYEDAIQTFKDIARDPTVDPGQRLKAAQYLWERVAGKIPDRVNIGVQDPWQQIIDGIIAEAPDGAPVTEMPGKRSAPAREVG